MSLIMQVLHAMACPENVVHRLMTAPRSDRSETESSMSVSMGPSIMSMLSRAVFKAHPSTGLLSGLHALRARAAPSAPSPNQGISRMTCCMSALASALLCLGPCSNAPALCARFP